MAELCLSEVANRFAKLIVPRMGQLDCSELLLYGSVAKGSKCPNDIDFLMLHRNPVIDFIDRERLLSLENEPILKVKRLNKLFVEGGYPCLDFLLFDPICKDALERGKVSMKYLDEAYFTDSRYRRQMDSRNWSPQFYGRVFMTGKLWDSGLQKFSIPSWAKYGKAYIKCRLDV